MPLDYLSTKSKNFFLSYADKIEQKKQENIYQNYFPFSDEKVTYNNIWNKLNLETICRNINPIIGGDGVLLESVSLYQTIDLIGEGPIEGICDKAGNTSYFSNDPKKNENIFRGVYFNDVPVKNTYSDTLNYNRVFSDIRLGSYDQNLLMEFENPSLNFTNSHQTFEYNAVLSALAPIDFEEVKGGISFVSPSYDSVVEVSTQGLRYAASFLGNYAIPLTTDSEGLQKVKSLEKKQPVKFNHLVTNDNAVFADINVSCILSHQGNDGDSFSAAVNFLIKIGYEGDETLLEEGGSVVYVYCSIEGIATSEYVRTFSVPLPPSINGLDRKITILRIDRENNVQETKESRSFQVKTVSEVIAQKINYTNSAVSAHLFDARAFSKVPKRTIDTKLLKVKIPSNYDPETKIYTGDWDGSFKKSLYWTDNPAWILYDLLTNKRYGLAKYGFKKAFVDKWNLYSIAKYCDELVPTGESSFVQPLTFTINAGGTEVSIDDSTLALGEDAYLNRYPEGATVCLYSLNTATDGTGTDLETGFKRIIYNPTYENETYKFTILQEPPVNQIFEDYPDLKRSYIFSQKNISAKNWIISKWLNSDNSSEQYVTDFIGGLSIDGLAKSGQAIIESFSNFEVLEPRFNCNIYFDQFQQALDALNIIASIFRGMTYWANNYIYISNDKKKDSFLLFNNSNVKDGVFSYSSSAKTARNTAVMVRYNDKTDSFKAKTVYIEDGAGIREYGFLLKEVVGLGITSKTQAKRIAKWNLLTAQTESDLVQFTTGTEGSSLMPNDVVKIQDKLKTIKRYAGRIVDLDYASKKITLDKGISENIVGQTITVILPRDIKTVRELNEESKLRIKSSLPAIPQAEVDKQRQSQIKEYTIAAVEDNKIITISETTDEEFNILKKGFLWSVQNTDSSLNIVEVEYRVVNVLEQSQNEYVVTGMLYNETKFDAVDFDDNVTPNQNSEPQTVIISNLPSSLTGSVSNGGLRNAISDYYDSYFTFKKTDYDKELFVDFSDLVTTNGLNAENTGGYIIEVYKDGQKVRFALDGYDNNQFAVFLGDRRLYKNINYEVYVYDTDYKLEDLGL